MGARGPAPKPTALRVVPPNGAAAVRAAAEPLPEDGNTDPPDWLDAPAREVWDRLAPDLRAKGVLTSWDVDGFAAFCDAAARHAEAAKLVAEGGVLVFGDKDRLVKNPACQLVRDYSTIMTSVGGRFGLTPSDRVGLIGKGDGDKDGLANPFAI